MTKLALALALLLAACVTDDDVGTPPQPTVGENDPQDDDDRDPIDPIDGLPDDSTCASFDGKGDTPCAP
jgi:hypothetical protein